MKVVILAGGLGTRLSEETVSIPKPMVKIGDYPIIWHIMKHYSHYGYHEFIICLGYKGYMLKEYFANYLLHRSSVTIDIRKNTIKFHDNDCEPWKITLVETGSDTMTGGRIGRIKEYVQDGRFMLTYGDGVSDIDLPRLLAHHIEQKSKCTLTAVRPEGRFGALTIQGSKVIDFQEKKDGDGHWINGGFFVCEPDIFRLIKADSTIWEQGPLETMARQGELSSFFHKGFWKAMDKLHDKKQLEQLWESGNAPWKIWKC